jgi:hypothetical protein
MKKKLVKIGRKQWLEAGMSRGYIIADGNGSLELRKIAMEPVTLTLLGTGAAMYAAGEGIGAAWNYFTGGRSFQEVLGGFKATTESVAQYETGLLALERELMPLLNSATLNVQEAAQDAIKQGRKTLDLLEQELLSKGMAVPNIDAKQKAEARAQQEREDKNLMTLFAAAQKPVGGTMPGDPETKTADISPEDASKKSGEDGKQVVDISKEVKETGKLPDSAGGAPAAAPAPSKSAPAAGGVSPSGGKQLNPRILGGG